MKLLTGSVAATIMTWGLLFTHPTAQPPHRDWVDKLVILGIASIFAAAAIVMAVSRRSWTFRGVGVFLTSIGTAVFYGELGYGDIVGYKIVNGRAQLPLSPGVSEAWLDVARACFLVGGPLLALGLIFWGIGRYNVLARDHDILESQEEASHP